VARLSKVDRRGLPDSAFAYVDSKGRRSLPIYDESHLRNALARFDQVKFESEASRDRARRRILQAAKKHGIVPVGFVTSQLETERVRVAKGEFPSGFLTLMFADVEGSTVLLHAMGDGYGRLLQSLRRLIRRVVVRSGGLPVDLRADEAFVVFENPAGAITAAVELQRTIAGSVWPGEVVVRLRIGLHSGEVSWTDAGYVGLTVHTAARVAAAAHGGQILVSDACRHAVGRPRGIGLRSIGRYRFAGFADPIQVYQADAEGLPRDFPALRSGKRVRGGGPGAVSSLPGP
jgi:class 3 adenylate cyclase